MRLNALTAAGLLAAALFGSWSGPAAADDAQKLVDDAAAMVRAMSADSSWADFAETYAEARAVILVPDFLEAGLIVGGGGGQCLILARSGPDDAWSVPSFCLVGEASIGLQIGFQKSEIVMMVMNEEALFEMLSGTAKFGGDAGLAMGLLGGGIEGATTLNADIDIFAFSRAQGLYGGVKLDGGWIEPDDTYNQAYYGRAVTASHIVVDRRVNNPATNPLSAALEQAEAVSSQ
jgi:lipid-binding SYLF domain-containing protein